MNVARQAALKAGLPVEVPAETVNRVCGSGLQAVVHAVEALRVGYVDTVVAGGTESMSNAPYLLEGRALGLPHGQRRGDRLDAGRRADVRDQRLPHGHHGRGNRQRATTSRAPTRTRSPPRASAARARPCTSGAFTAEIVPVDGAAEEGRPGARRHRRVSAAGHDGREAGGAEAGVQEGRHGHGRQRVGHQRRRRRARRRRRRDRRASSSARRRWRASCRTPSTGVDPDGHGHRARCRPCARRSSARASTIGDIDLFELNEAFAAQSLAVVRELGARSGEGERERRRDRARPSDRRQRRARADDARLRAARAEAALRRRVAVHRRRHGHRDGRRSARERSGVSTPRCPCDDDRGARARGGAAGRVLRHAARHAGAITEAVPRRESRRRPDTASCIDPRDHIDARREARAPRPRRRRLLSLASATRRRCRRRPISRRRRIRMHLYADRRACVSASAAETSRIYRLRRADEVRRGVPFVTGS